MKFGSFFLRPAGTIPLSAVHSEDVALFLLICVAIVFYLKLTLELDELFKMNSASTSSQDGEDTTNWSLVFHTTPVDGREMRWEPLGAFDRLIIDEFAERHSRDLVLLQVRTTELSVCLEALENLGTPRLSEVAMGCS